MTFGPHHYVPVLKVKRGEKVALTRLSAAVRQRVSPMFEIVERKDKPVAAHLETAFDGLAAAAGIFDRCFIDVREIEPEGPAAANDVFERAANSGIIYAPVTGISRTAHVTAAMAHRAHGLALRLRRDEFEAGGLGARIRTFMARHGLAAEEVDLIVDLGAVDQMVAPGVQQLASAFLAEVPDHTRWRTFILSACGFPISMGILDSNSHVLIERPEWLAWRDAQYARRQSLVRLPTYSDGAIQHPKGVEGFDPRTMQVSASIRYTVPESWLLIKGESTRFNPPGQQFPALATQLVYGHLKTHYYGPSHCEGCKSMKAAADGAPRLGSAEVWRRLGTIHHITTTVEELGALPWP